MRRIGIVRYSLCSTHQIIVTLRDETATMEYRSVFVGDTTAFRGSCSGWGTGGRRKARASRIRTPDKTVMLRWH
jgi:hypothetical protein